MTQTDSIVRLIRADALTDTAPYAYAATTDGPARLVFAAGARSAGQRTLMPLSAIVIVRHSSTRG